MKTKVCLSIVLMVAALAAVPLWAQNFPAKGDDHVQSFGKFWILIDPAYQPLFSACPAPWWDGSVLQSPTLYENGTVIGRSDPIQADPPPPPEPPVVQVGLANVPIHKGGFTLPSGFTPIAPHSYEVRTDIYSLNMVTFGGGPMARVRAGRCYSGVACSSDPPVNRVSKGEVVSNHSPAGSHPDFPARSFFDVFAQIDVPTCGSFPGATVYNGKPLLVNTPSIGGFPPSGVVYTHDSSSAVAVKFLAAGHARDANGRDVKWEKGDRLGCVILAGHGVIPVFRRVGELEKPPSAVPVALQKEKISGAAEQRMRPPNKEETEREARKFEEHMKGEHEREGGRHKDCGPKEKDDDDDHGHGHDRDHDHE